MYVSECVCGRMCVCVIDSVCEREGVWEREKFCVRVSVYV